jgi:hypothetical protein
LTIKGATPITDLFISLVLDINTFMLKQFDSYCDSILNEDKTKRDRCLKRADSVYGKKTSAYKSGAVVKCRKGKIWKKK